MHEDIFALTSGSRQRDTTKPSFLVPLYKPCERALMWRCWLAWCARQRGLIFSPEFRCAEFSMQLNARTAAAAASTGIPNDLAVAGYFPVQVRHSRAGHVEHYRTISSSCFKGLCPGLWMSNFTVTDLLADLDHDLRRTRLLRRTDDAGYFGLDDLAARLAISRLRLKNRSRRGRAFEGPPRMIRYIRSTSYAAVPPTI